MQANGRINLLTHNLLDTPNPMMLYDRDNKEPTTYHEALNGTWSSSPLSTLFFSAQNQQILQNGIRAGVHRMSGGKFVISNQSIRELQMIMRAIYLQYSVNQPGNTTMQCSRLNEIVLGYAVPRVYGEAKGYMNYLRDASTLVVPLARPVNSITYDKTLELKNFF